MTITVAFTPYIKGIYIGEEIERWLDDNIGEEKYRILPVTIELMVSSRAHPTEYYFENDEDAVAFKLRWS